MTQEDIIRMALEAEFKEGEIALMGDNFIRFAALIAAHEREAASERAWKVLINKGADWSVRQMVSDAIKGERNEPR